MNLYNFPTHHKGDTFEALDFYLSQLDTELPGATKEPIDLTGFSVKMEVRYNNPRGSVAKTFTTDDGMEIVNAANGLIRFKEQTINLRAGKYYYEIQFTSPEGVVSTYFGGYWIIEEDGTL